VEAFLKQALLDSTGALVVDESGPHWNGLEKLKGLSYSNTFSSGEGWGVVVFSRTHELGVDLEKSNRLLKQNYLEIAERFFHDSEYESLKRESIFDGPEKFLNIWMQKEAYSKLKREPLVRYLSESLSADVVFESLMKIRQGYRAILAIS
jgi:phosphopantetheinyl transferase (holo-ACP synthase)